MKLKRVWLLAILLVMFSLVLFVAFLPTLLSSAWGQSRLLAYANQRVNGKVAARQVKLSWFGSQTVEGLTLHDSAGRKIASIDSLKLESSLLRLVRSIPTQLKASLTGLNASIDSDAQGVTNLQKALGLHVQEDKKVAPYAIELKETSGVILFRSLNAPMAVHLAGTTLQGSLEGRFHIDAELSGFDPEKVHTLNAEVIHFPVALLDQFVSLSDPKLSGLLHAGLGETLDATLEHAKTSSGVTIKGRVNSSTIQAELRGIFAHEAFALTEPATLRLNLTPELTAKLVSAEIVSSGFNVEGPLDLKIETLSIPLSPVPALSRLEAGLQFNFQNRPVKLALQMSCENQRIEASVKADPIDLNVAEWGALTLRDLALKFNGKRGSTGSLNLTTRVALSGKLSQFLGSSADLKLSSGLTSGLTLDDIQTSLKSEVADMQLTGQLVDNGFLLTSPATISYTLTPSVLEAAGVNEPLQASQPLRFTIEPNRKPIDHQDLSTLYLKGNLEIDSLALGAPQSAAHAALNHVAIPWVIDASANTMTFELAGETTLEQESAGKLQGKIHISDWILDGRPSLAKMQMKADLALSPLPISLVEAIFAKPGLTVVLGKSVDIDLKANWAAKDPRSFVDIQLRGQKLDANAALTIGDTVSLKEGSPLPRLSIALTPERFRALHNLVLGETGGNVVLAEPAILNVTLTKLNLPLARNKKAWADGSLSAGISLDKLRLSDRSSRQTFELGAIQARIDSPRIGQEIQFNLQGSQLDPGTQVSQLAIEGKLTQLLTPEGSWNPQKMTVKAKAHLQNFPASLVCRALNLDRGVRLKMEALLGPVIAADMLVQIQQLNGPLQIAVEGQNGRVQLDGQLSQGTLLLQKPFELEVAVTPELGQAVLQDLVPLLSGIISAEQRLRLTIDPAGFALPLDFSNRGALQIGQMSLELGKMQFSNEGQFGKLMNVLRVQDTDVMSVWFTPLYVSVANGVVSIQRFDMLLMQAYPIAAWGTIDLPGNYIDMIVGLSGRTLQRAIGFTTLDRDFMMQLPLRGQIGSAKLDRGKIAGKIAALAAQMQGTPQGVVLGTVISLATGGGLLEEKAPPPTTNPLPWETAADSDQAAGEQNNRSDNPVEMLQKGANSLLQNLFR